MVGLRASRRRKVVDAAYALYGEAVAQARAPAFYLACGVPDSLDGRFEMIALHAFLIMRRLKDGGAEAAAVSQALFDAMFADMDRNLREMGASDLGVGKRVKTMARSFYGRVGAYDEALAAPDDSALGAALRRNLFGTVEPGPAQLAAMAGYVRCESDALARQATADLVAGRVRFGPPPEAA